MTIDLNRVGDSAAYDPPGEPAADTPAPGAADPVPTWMAGALETAPYEEPLNPLPAEAAPDLPMLPDQAEIAAASSGAPRKMTIQSLPNSTTSKSKYTYRYTYGYRYLPSAGGRMLRVVLRAKLKPTPANVSHAAKPHRSAARHGAAARHALPPDAHQKAVDRINAWRDGVLQLHAPSTSNYERSVVARELIESANADAADGLRDEVDGADAAGLGD